MIVEFPPVETADPETGLLAFGGDLTIGSLELAYRSGIFPWPAENQPILWFAPPERAIIEFSEFKIPKRLERSLKKSPFTFRINSNFAEVIKNCANLSSRKNQQGTWITDEMISAYIEFHKAGFAHSFEILNKNDKLVGGLYGVLINKYFAGESMFYKETNASKFALIQTVQYLKTLEISWMDVQILNPFLATFGANEISRDLFMQKLNQALNDHHE